jgi:hypothetical protein
MVRPRSRARATQDTTDAGLSVSRVSRRALPAQRNAPLAGRAGDIGVEGAVEDARGVLGAGQVTAQPEQLLGDPRQHGG